MTKTPRPRHREVGHAFQIVWGGHPRAGVWRMIGDQLVVTSAYGEMRVELGTRGPRTVAEMSLARLVSAYVEAQDAGG